jgi:hypothetical protein
MLLPLVLTAEPHRLDTAGLGDANLSTPDMRSQLRAALARQHAAAIAFAVAAIHRRLGDKTGVPEVPDRHLPAPPAEKWLTPQEALAGFEIAARHSAMGAVERQLGRFSLSCFTQSSVRQRLCGGRGLSGPHRERRATGIRCVEKRQVVQAHAWNLSSKELSISSCAGCSSSSCWSHF